MSTHVDTDVESLKDLQKHLYDFYHRTETLYMRTVVELDEFEATVKRALDNIEENSRKDFHILWNRYINSKDCFQSNINRLLHNDIINEEGRRNIFTLVAILEEYLK